MFHAAGSGRRLEELPVVELGVEASVILDQVDDALDQAHDSRNPGPAQKDVDDAGTDLAHVELVNTDSTQQDA